MDHRQPICWLCSYDDAFVFSLSTRLCLSRSVCLSSCRAPVCSFFCPVVLRVNHIVSSWLFIFFHSLCRHRFIFFFQFFFCCYYHHRKTEIFFSKKVEERRRKNIKSLYSCTSLFSFCFSYQLNSFVTRHRISVYFHF